MTSIDNYKLPRFGTLTQQGSKRRVVVHHIFSLGGVSRAAVEFTENTGHNQLLDVDCYQLEMDNPAQMVPELRKVVK